MMHLGRVLAKAARCWQMTRRIGVAGWCSLAAIVLLLFSLGAGALVVRQRALGSGARTGAARRSPRATMLLRASAPRLAQRWSHDGEVFFLLGENELERGRKEPPDRRAESRAAGAAALAAWEKVPTASPYFGVPAC